MISCKHGALLFLFSITTVYAMDQDDLNRAKKRKGEFDKQDEEARNTARTSHSNSEYKVDEDIQDANAINTIGDMKLHIITNKPTAVFNSGLHTHKYPKQQTIHHKNEKQGWTEKAGDIAFQLVIAECVREGIGLVKGVLGLSPEKNIEKVMIKQKELENQVIQSELAKRQMHLHIQQKIVDGQMTEKQIALLTALARMQYQQDMPTQEQEMQVIELTPEQETELRHMVEAQMKKQEIPASAAA